MGKRNRGAVALARTGKSQTAIAAEMGVSNVTAHHWASGEKKPGPANRAKAFELYGIGESWWDESPDAKAKGKPAAATPAQPAEDTAAAIGGTFGMARELEDMIQQQLTEARQELAKPRDKREGTPLELAKLTVSLVPALAHLAKLTGQYDLGRRMLQLPIWRRIESEIAEALKGHPEAAAAVAERFEALDKSSRLGG